MARLIRESALLLCSNDDSARVEVVLVRESALLMISNADSACGARHSLTRTGTPTTALVTRDAKRGGAGIRKDSVSLGGPS